MSGIRQKTPPPPKRGPDASLFTGAMIAIAVSALAMNAAVLGATLAFGRPVSKTPAPPG